MTSDLEYQIPMMMKKDPLLAGLTQVKKMVVDLMTVDLFSMMSQEGLMVSRWLVVLVFTLQVW